MDTEHHRTEDRPDVTFEAGLAGTVGEGKRVFVLDNSSSAGSLRPGAAEAVRGAGRPAHRTRRRRRSAFQAVHRVTSPHFDT
jgi:hypothetical protein